MKSNFCENVSVNLEIFLTDLQTILSNFVAPDVYALFNSTLEKYATWSRAVYKLDQNRYLGSTPPSLRTDSVKTFLKPSPTA